MNKKDKIAKARECFKADEKGKYDKLFVTSDGQCFPDEHYSNEHQKGVDKKESVLIVSREDVAEDNDKLSATKAIEMIKASSDPKEIEVLVKDEDRVTVKEAAAKRLEELKGQS